MKSQQHRWPLFLRAAFVAAVTGVAGWLGSSFGVLFVDSAGSAQLRDTMLIVGTAIMTVGALISILAAVLAIAHSLREREFRWTHGTVILVATLVTLAAGIDGAYPR